MRAALLMLPLLLSACMAELQPSPPQPIGGETSPQALLPRGPVWRITRAGGMDAPAGTNATLTRTDGGIQGNGGCNQYSGRATITADRLDFHDIISTLMACADRAPMEFEGKVAAALNTADGVAGTPGGDLTLTAGGRPVATLVPQSSR